ncbi:MAG: hypothetical protein EBY29_00685 [Planctomycetes bacterium]|nr:hypothetical protein [Planctomycetota bacterium]
MYQQDSITSNDITGVAALSAPYARKAQQLQGMPLAKQLETLLSQGLDASTAALVLKARRLKELAKAGGNQPASQSKVSDEVDQAFREYVANKNRNSGGVAGLPVRSDMYSDMEKGYARGGIVAFQSGGGMPQGNPNPGMYGQQAFDRSIDRSISNAGPYGLGMRLPGPYGANTQPAAAAAPPAGAEADPAMVSQLFNEARGVKDPYMSSLEEYMSGKRDVNVDMSELKKSIKEQADYAKRLEPKERDKYLTDLKAKAVAAGLNKAEADALIENQATLSEATDYYNKAKGRGLVAAGSSIMEQAEKRLPGNAFSQLASAVIAGGGAYNKEKAGAERDFMAAKLQLRQADTALKSAMARNELGLIDKAYDLYKNDVTAYNNALKDLTDAQSHLVANQVTQANHNAGQRAAAAGSAAYARNPGMQYQAGIASLTQTRLAAEGRGDKAGVAAADAAINRMRDLQLGATDATPAARAAQIRAASAEAVKKLSIVSAEKIAAMKDREVIDLEKEISNLIGIAQQTQDQTSLAILEGKQKQVEARKAALGMGRGGGAPESSGPRVINVESYTP